MVGKREAALAVGATLLLVGLVWYQQEELQPANIDHAGDVGDRYAFALGDLIARQDGVSFYWVHCGVDPWCGPVAVQGAAPEGAVHLVVEVPGGDVQGRTMKLPWSVKAYCGWRSQYDTLCQSGQSDTNVTEAWGPYEVVDPRLEQAAIGLALGAFLGAAGRLVGGPGAGISASLAGLAGTLVSSLMALDSFGVYWGALFFAAPAALGLGLLSLNRSWRAITMPLLVALAASLFMAALFGDYFPSTADV